MNKRFCIIAICLMIAGGLFATSEQDILKDAYADYSTPIVINYVTETALFTKEASSASFQEMTTIGFTNISDQPIKTINFEYIVYDENHKQLYKNKISSKNVVPFATQKTGSKNGKIEKQPLSNASILRKKVASAKNNVVEITKISIQFNKGKKDLSKAEIEECLYRAELDLYSNDDVLVKLKYNPLGKKCNLITETAFENAYLSCKFDTDEDDTDDAEESAEEEDEEAEDDDDEDVAIKSTKEGSVYITKAPFDESDASYAEMIVVDYLAADEAEGKSLSAMQKKAKRIIIDDEEKLDQVRNLAAILNTIM